MMDEIDNKLFIITGSAKGIGKGLAQIILENGGSVMLSDINEEQGVETLKHFRDNFSAERVSFNTCDVSDAKSFLNLWNITEQIFGRCPNVLLNNAGITHEQGWKKCLDVNLKGTYNGTLLAIERMSKKNEGSGGTVINIGSTAGFLPSPNVESSSYFISKSCVVNLTRNLACDRMFKEDGIRYLCLCPAYVDTDFLTEDIRKHIQEVKRLKILSVNVVQKGFLQLFKNGRNGDVSVILNEESPPIYWPNYEGKYLVPLMMLSSKYWNKITSVAFGERQQLMLVFVALFLLYGFIRMFMSFVISKLFLN